MRTIDQELQEARERKGNTVRELAVLFDADQSTVSQWLNGRRNPDPKYRALFVAKHFLTAQQAHAPFKRNVKGAA